jgi:hypothetical protein
MCLKDGECVVRITGEKRERLVSRRALLGRRCGAVPIQVLKSLIREERRALVRSETSYHGTNYHDKTQRSSRHSGHSCH